VPNEDFVTCAWSLKGDVKSKTFPAAALKKADEPGPEYTDEERAKALGVFLARTRQPPSSQ